MKKSSIVLMVLILVSIGFAAIGADGYGVGNPYSVTPAAIGEIYVNTSTGSVWRANSTAKGDFTKLAPVLGDGSASAPFPLMKADLVDAEVLSVDVLKFSSISEVTIGASASLTADISNLTNVVLANATATANVLNIPHGVDGQLLNVVLIGVATETDSLVVTPASGTATTLNVVGEGCSMVYTNDHWYVVGRNN